MILKNLFKGVRNKVMIALAGLTMVFGVGAAVSNVVSTQQNEVVETKAASTISSGKYIYARGASGYKLHLWNSSNSTNPDRAWDQDGGFVQIGTSDMYYHTANNNVSSYDRFIIRSNSSQTGDLNGSLDGKILYDINVNGGSSTWSIATLQSGRFYVAGDFNGWNTTANEINFSSSGAFAHRYSTSINIPANKREFKLVFDGDYKGSQKWAGIDTKVRNATDGNNFICPGPGTLTVWMTPSACYYGQNGFDVFQDANEAGISFAYAAYTVSFNANGGSVDPTSKTVTYNSTYGALPTPTKTGHTFDGWYTAASGGTKVNATDTVTITDDQELFAHWTADTYTITFYQNDGTDFSRTATKTYGVNFTIPNPGEGPLSDMGASGGRKFLRWDTHSKGDGTSYPAGTIYTANASLELYMIQDWYTYEYSTNGGSTWNALVRSGGDTPTGYVAQFEPASNQTFASGTVLTFRRYYGSSATAENVEIINWQGGNYGTSIVYAFTGKIYLKVTSLNVHDVVVEGYSQRSIAITRGGVTTMYHMAVTDTTHFYTDEPVEIYPGDVIQGVYNHEDTHVRDTYKLVSATGDGSWTGGGDAGDVVSRSFGVFVVTLFGESVSNVDKVSFAVDVSASAILFAQVFNSEIGTVCTGIEGGSSASGLVTPWGRQKSYFDGLVAAAQTAVKSDSGSSNTDVVACRAKYDQVCGKYGPNGQAITGITDFMGRNPKPKTSGAGLIPGAPGNNQSPLTTTLWIVFGCGLAGLGAIGTAYFVSKKKKKNHVA